MRLLLHICCAPDATVALERLPECQNLLLFFDNPNIFPIAEYHKRLAALNQLCSYTGTKYLEGAYDPESWQKAISGYEADLEGGDRCRICIAFRLERSAKFAREHGFDTLGTVLSTSPHKRTATIHQLAEETAPRFGLAHLKEDFKKRDGFKRSVELSRLYGLYRQNYCGCEYSLRRSQHNRTGVKDVSLF